MPTPPAAAVTTTRSPAPTSARAHTYHAVRKETANAAASTGFVPSGIGKTRAAGTATFSACPPKIGTATTGWPGRNSATPSPTDSTTPETSIPGTNGGRGVRG